MSNVVPKIAVDFTPEQIQLIKATVAKGATDDELKLFLYRCQNMGLDPLKPGMVHFIKYSNAPGTIVVGIDGFRAKAQSTGLFAGISRGVIRDDKGKCIGAWCEVTRSDWKAPAREEVSLAEYNTHKAMWAKMPETMIKKVAEAAALRMAFPDHLAGVYSDDEMAQAEVRDARQTHNQIQAPKSDLPDLEIDLNDVKPIEEIDELDQALNQPSLGDYVIKAGKNKGRKLGELKRTDMSNWISWYDEQVDQGKQFNPDVNELYEKMLDYIAKGHG